MRRNTITTGALVFILAVSVFGCGKCDTADKKDVVAYVNKEPITGSELARALALKAKQDPTFRVTAESEAEMLDTIINRKIIIQSAMDAGLARQDKFINTIKGFWEQTLIRDFIEYKQKAFQDYTFATEDEIKSYYDDLVKNGTTETLDALRPEITARIVSEKETRLFEEWLKSERAKTKIKICR